MKANSLTADLDTIGRHNIFQTENTAGAEPYNPLFDGLFEIPQPRRLCPDYALGDGGSLGLRLPEPHHQRSDPDQEQNRWEDVRR
jgi:hypothetical protein